ncbi:unnamed protein product [Arabidopsis arenosa]|uniref:Glycine-rich protein n=1 Tax=Arabidopsis arenosa TaxID=38785 RepID=A0A8S2B294_ARAAE|nr:unnamed protein product [Arabidopsis arenosa]
MFDITNMRITKTRAHFVTNYAVKLAVLLIITLLLFKCTTVVAGAVAIGEGGGHASVGGGHASAGGGHAVEGGGHAVEGGGHAAGGAGGHGEEEGGHGIGRGGGIAGMVHRPATRNGGSILITPFADGSAIVFMIIFFLFN